MVEIKTYKKVCGLLLALLVSITGVAVELNPIGNEYFIHVNEANAATEYVFFIKASDGSNIQIPVQVYTADTDSDGIADTPYKYIEITVSGQLILPKGISSVDVFLVGGGGGGGTGNQNYAGGTGGAGGGGGYTKKVMGISVSTTPVSITIGAGGASGTAGGNTSFGPAVTVAGGGRGADGRPGNDPYWGHGTSLGGGNGGSGGGFSRHMSTITNPSSNNGGSNGGNGDIPCYSYHYNNSLSEFTVLGKGQGTTTSDFLGRIHSGGGGGGQSTNAEATGIGGAGFALQTGAAQAGSTINYSGGTGGKGYGGGGGGGGASYSPASGGRGADGFCMIRWNANNNPAINIGSPVPERAFSLFIPFKGTVNDTDIGDVLTVKYKLDSGAESALGATATSDGTEKAFDSNIDISPLGEGNHTLSIWVCDNKGGTSEVQIIPFVKDITPPNIMKPSVTADSPYQISASGAATDANGLDEKPYLYNKNGIDTNWQAGAFIDENLEPNTQYTYKYKARDRAGNTGNYSEASSAYTFAEIPSLELVAHSPTSVDLTVNDSNPGYTKYQIMSGNKYVTVDGLISAQETWITLEDKSLHVTGLQMSSSQSFKIKARNEENIETEFTPLFSVDVPEAIPQVEIFSPTGNHIFTQQFLIKYIVRDEYANQIKTDIKIGTKTYCTNADTAKNTELSFTLGAGDFKSLPDGENIVTITAVNEFGGVDSKLYFFTKSRVPLLEAVTPAGTKIDFTWLPVAYATGYQLELDGKLIDTGLKTSYTYSGLQPKTQHIYRLRTIGADGLSQWSPLERIYTTDGLITAMPQNLTALASNSTITLNWEAVEDAEGYEICQVLSDGSSGAAVSNDDLTTAEFRGLLPGNIYRFRVRAVNSAGEGPWSNAIQVATMLLDTPGNVLLQKNDTSISFVWDAVPGAEGYELKYGAHSENEGSPGEGSWQPGVTVEVVSGSGIALKELVPSTEYKYSIRAKSSGGYSAWSEEMCVFTLPQKPGVPEKVNASVTDTKIIINWTGPLDNSLVGYDIELDGIILENDTLTTYVHEGLEPYTLHTYRVRARNELVEGDWSAASSIRTLPSKPQAPENITVKSTQTGAVLAWAPQLGAKAYDIYVFRLDDNGNEIKVEETNNIGECTYTHRRQIKGEEYRYRLRTRNIRGISSWSGDIINNAIKAQCRKGNTLDLGLTATDVVDFGSYEMVVTYNPGVVEVADLSTLTGAAELTAGKIEGTGITIKEFSPGRIVFAVDKAVTPGEAWTGVINGIKFKARETGGTTITYTVFTRQE